MRDTKTKRELFMELLAIDEVNGNNELVAFVEHELELLNRKSKGGTRKPSAKQRENEELLVVLRDMVNEVLEVPMSVTDICAELSTRVGKSLSTQKVTPLMGALLKEGVVTRFEDKGKSLYLLA